MVFTFAERGLMPFCTRKSISVLGKVDFCTLMMRGHFLGDLVKMVEMFFQGAAGYQVIIKVGKN
jgi:hypothetical protein